MLEEEAAPEIGVVARNRLAHVEEVVVGSQCVVLCRKVEFRVEDRVEAAAAHAAADVFGIAGYGCVHLRDFNEQLRILDCV